MVRHCSPLPRLRILFPCSLSFYGIPAALASEKVLGACSAGCFCVTLILTPFAVPFLLRWSFKLARISGWVRLPPTAPNNCCLLRPLFRYVCDDGCIFSCLPYSVCFLYACFFFRDRCAPLNSAVFPWRDILASRPSISLEPMFIIALSVYSSSYGVAPRETVPAWPHHLTPVVFSTPGCRVDSVDWFFLSDSPDLVSSSLDFHQSLSRLTFELPNCRPSLTDPELFSIPFFPRSFFPSDDFFSLS